MKSVDVLGHSMGGLCALGLAIEHPALVDRLALVNTLSGWSATRRWSVPHNWSPWRDRAWRQCMWRGTRQMLGQGNLAVYKRLNSLVAEASYVEKRHTETWPIEPGDEDRPPPPRAIWLRTVRQVDYRDRLGQVTAQTLICAARYDPQTPLPCSDELHEGITNAQTCHL